MKPLMTPEERREALTAAMQCLKALQDDDRRLQWENTRENTIKEIESVLANPTQQPIKKSKFQIISQSDIDALLRPFKEENDETLEDEINKTEYKSKEFYSVLDEINKKDYDWMKEP